MHNIKFYPIVMSLSFLAAASTALADDINCTKAPDCATLGYTKTSADCPKGGVKCPFDSNKMFCLKNTTAYDFQITQAVKLYDVVYHDGTTSTNTAVAGKTPIGLVYHVNPGSDGKHGLIMSLEQPVVGTRPEAIEYCNNYVIKGTNVGDWRLPTLPEMLHMGNEYSLGKLNTKYWDLQKKLIAIKNADPLTYGGAVAYAFIPDNITNPKSINSIRNNSLVSSGYYMAYARSYGYAFNTGSYAGYFNQPVEGPVVGGVYMPAYWSISDYGGNYHYVIQLNKTQNNHAIGNSSNSLYGHFRCIMDF